LSGFCKGIREENPGALNICGSRMHTYTLMVLFETEMSDFGPHEIKRLAVANSYYPDRV
jgi:hypothetical protein